MNTTINTRFEDLIKNARPQQIPTFDKDDNFRGFRDGNASLLSIDINDPILQDAELRALPVSTRVAFARDLNTANASPIANSSKVNLTTWKHVINGSGILARAGMAVDSSSNFEGVPFFAGFDASVASAWLGENATIPESSSSTVSFPYSIHSVGAFTIVSRRMKALSSHLIAQAQIAQANSIKEAVEQALINGDAATNVNQPDGLVKQLTGNVISGAAKTGLVNISEALEVLEGSGIYKDDVSIIASPDVGKIWRQEIGAKSHPALSLILNRIFISKHMPAGTSVTGRFSDFQAITSTNIDFLAHTHTPEGIPETGATRVRSMFDVDAIVLNQESFVKTVNISA